MARVGIAHRCRIGIGDLGQIVVVVSVGDDLALRVGNRRDVAAVVGYGEGVAEVAGNLGQKPVRVGHGEGVAVGVGDLGQFPVGAEGIGEIALFPAEDELARGGQGETVPHTVFAVEVGSVGVGLEYSGEIEGAAVGVDDFDADGRRNAA